MKAAVVVANEDVQYQEVEEPQVTPGHVKIKIRYSGICGSDIPRIKSRRTFLSHRAWT